jgi:cytoskeletal protein CcmA (bactofilin family)
MSAASSLEADSLVANATVGKSVVIKGQIVSLEDLTIQGEVEGTIEIGGHRLTIASDGKVRADVNARELEVIGSMQGKVEAAEKVYVRDGASVVGDIHSAGIVIEDGAYIKGGIDLSRPHTDRQESSELLSTEAHLEIQELSHAVLTS